MTGAGGTTNVPQRETRVSGQLGRLDHSINRLEGLVHDVTDRLAGVLINEPPATPAPGLDKETLVPLAKALDGFTGRIQHVSDNLVGLMERLEL